MRKKSLLIRADCRPEFGLGHVVRCAALAQMLTPDWEVKFLLYRPSDAVKAIVHASGATCISRTSGWGYLVDDWRELDEQALKQRRRDETMEIIARGAGSIVVVDHYGRDHDFLSGLRDSGLTVMHLDDFARGHFKVDAILNHGCLAAETDYSRESYTLTGLGPGYALLRAPFLEYRSRMGAQIQAKLDWLATFGNGPSEGGLPLEPESGPVSEGVVLENGDAVRGYGTGERGVGNTKLPVVFVFTGGADPEGLNLRLAKLLVGGLLIPMRMIMVITGSNPSREELEGLAARLAKDTDPKGDTSALKEGEASAARDQHVEQPDMKAAENPDGLKRASSVLEIRVQLNASEMLAAISEAQLAIVPASGVSYEVASVGLGMIFLQTAENQAGLASFLERKGMGLRIDPPALETELPKALKAFVAHPERLQAQFRAQWEVFDGQSPDRIRNLLEQLWPRVMGFRIPTEADARLYFDWANDPLVRQQSYNQDAIPWESHLPWFKRRLEDIDAGEAYLYLFEDHAGTPIGQVRYQPDEGAWVIGISVAASARGKGYSSRMLGMACLALKSNFPWEMARWPVIAYIKVENQASYKAFKRAGFGPEAGKAEDEIIDYKGSKSYKLYWY